MNLEQIRLRAESQSGYFKDSDCVKIFIASQVGNTAGRVIADVFRKRVKEKNLDARIITAGSFGSYDIEPIVLIEKPENPCILYKNTDPIIVSELIDDYLLKDNPRPDLAFCSIGREKIEGITSADDLPLFNPENRIVLRNCGYLDPENIDHYILRGGYTGLSSVLNMNQSDVIENVRKSGLRGRGGAGYPTADKWRACLEIGGERYVICNAADSDPGAFTARLLLTSDPYSVLEGMLICAYAIGASKCTLFTDSEYKPGIKMINTAYARMKEYGLLGNNILNSGFSCEIEVRASKISLVSGEETAVLRSLENKQAMPYLRPPYPETRGLFGKPTAINNIETLANVTAIFQYNPEKIADIGTESVKGTKVLSLSSNGSTKCTIEVPFGSSLRDIIEQAEIITNVGGIKGVQFGGPTGSFVPENGLDIAIDYETIKGKSFIGSGTLELIDDTACAVEMAMKKISYLHEQSCGKCVFCREGTFQMSEILEDICKGKGRPQDIEMLDEIGEHMQTGCICDLGRRAPNPVLSSIEHFRNEYEDHIRGKTCPGKGST
ncbi:MAG: NADH-quinone oxidoreductase subunit F [Deltaproteobacteria bacterium]|nr:NADH-quinone oxidoreductase subunit F [Deltaproteobacteria bacterium]